MDERLLSAGGLFVFIGLAWCFSESRRDVSWRLVGLALGLQIVLALAILRTGAGEALFDGVRRAFTIINDAALEGSRFIFGPLTEVFVLEPDAVVGAETPLEVNAVIAFQVLPLVIVVSCLAAMLYHLHVVQGLVRAMAWLMRRTFKTSGAETFGTAILIFFGIESVPTLKGYLQTMTRSELFTLMTAFMATVAANVMVMYATFGAEPGHLLAASLMSAPAAILMAKVLVPETGAPVTAGSAAITVPVESHNFVDAASRGASEGLQLALNIGAMLIAFVSMIYLLNLTCSAVFGYSFTAIMGWAFYPFAFLMGVPREDVGAVAQLLGTKTVINEFIAYSDMQALISEGALEPRSVTISTYALCGFANPGSLGILIACLTGLIPGRRGDVTRLGLKSLAAGTLAVFTTACIAGVIA